MKLIVCRLGGRTLDSKVLVQVLNEGINALPSGFALFDAQDRAVFTNQVFREMLPEGAEALDNGATFPEMARLNAMTRFGLEGEALEDWIHERIAYRDAPKDYFDQKLTDGRWFRIQESRTSDGGTVTNWTDITDLKEQEKIAADYADALTATNQRLDEFARAASHDLQEPLRKIETFGGRLSDKAASKLDEAETRYLDRICDATGRMRRLITSLLEFSRAANQEVSFVEVDLNEAIDQARQNLEIQIQDRQAIINVAPLPKVSGDLDQLSRLFQNIISNAIKYVEPGVTPIVFIDLIEAGEGITQIIVKDNGIGFEQVMAEKIFEPFQRLHGRGARFEGTGIGLASCRKIVEQHRGSIRAESAPGTGSTFFVVLPLEVAKAAAA